MEHVVSPFGGSASERQRRILTGSKTFASDFRPKDLNGWPEQCAHALLLRAAVAGRTFVGVDINRLRLEMQPDVLITATDLGEQFRNYIEDVEVELLVNPGNSIDYVGQPVALLLYSGFMRFRRAAQELREDAGPIVYGPHVDATATTIEEELKAWRGLNPLGLQKEVHYLLSLSDDESQWSQGVLTRHDRGFSRTDAPNPESSNELFKSLSVDSGGPRIETTTFTQTIDPAFLEPEAGLAWFDRNQATLHLLVGTQSPYGDVEQLQKIVGKDKSLVKQIHLETTNIGGGFGGRDKSPFTIYLALAAMFSRTPVRLAFDRREQFQGGLKRHSSAVHSQMQASPDGRLETIHTFTVLRGGPEVNLNGAVLGLAALHATGPYRVPRAGSHAVVVQRPIPTVGSMRGFGIPQVIFNIETAVDRLAVLELGADPIAFREKNVLRQGDDCDLAGTPLRFHLATAQICELAQQHPLWQKRTEIEQSDDLRNGVGFACCIEAYGTSQDSTYSAVGVTTDGGVDVWAQTMDMGQGARQTLELVVAEELGGNARVELGLTGWFEAFAALLTGGPHDDLKISLSHGASSASKTAFFHVHTVREACRALLRLRLLPTARTILGKPDLTDAELLAAWKNGALELPGLKPLRLADLASALHRSGQQPGVMVHTYFCNGWSGADFTVDGQTASLAADALALIRGPGDTITPVVPDGNRLRRPSRAPSGANPPRSVYASGAHLIGVAIDCRRGRISVTDAITFLDAGDIISEPVVDGQVEGGLAMGIAHTLFEELPPETGAGPFTNFDRYRLPRWGDLRGIHRRTVPIKLGSDGILGPGQPSVRHKGIGEVTMTTVAPAIANAIAHALGHSGPESWPTRTPIRFKDLKMP